MTAIQQALGTLYQSIENLEAAAEGQKMSLKMMRQKDLFSGKNAIDAAALARKLDSTIGKVELMLREA